jgi:hypothetical protein
MPYERDITRRPNDFEKYAFPNTYVDYQVDLAWEAWQAAREQVTEQRDRLAEAMLQMWPFIEEDDYPNCNTPAFNAAILKYNEALQSLTTNAKSPASDGFN